MLDFCGYGWHITGTKAAVAVPHLFNAGHVLLLPSLNCVTSAALSGQGRSERMERWMIAVRLLWLHSRHCDL